MLGYRNAHTLCRDALGNWQRAVGKTGIARLQMWWHSIVHIGRHSVVRQEFTKLVTASVGYKHHILMPHVARQHLRFA